MVTSNKEAQGEEDGSEISSYVEGHGGSVYPEGCLIPETDSEEDEEVDEERSPGQHKEPSRASPAPVGKVTGTSSCRCSKPSVPSHPSC